MTTEFIFDDLDVEPSQDVPIAATGGRSRPPTAVGGVPSPEPDQDAEFILDADDAAPIEPPPPPELEHPLPAGARVNVLQLGGGVVRQAVEYSGSVESLRGHIQYVVELDDGTTAGTWANQVH